VAEAPDSAGHLVPKPVLCPKCDSDRTHRSHRRSRFEQLVSRVAIYPYRCRACGHRFLKFRYAAPDEEASTPIRHLRRHSDGAAPYPAQPSGHRRAAPSDIPLTI
jgi:predicted Zn-ribbon and HTH transcriptional regulator